MLALSFVLLWVSIIVLSLVVAKIRRQLDALADVAAGIGEVQDG